MISNKSHSLPVSKKPDYSPLPAHIGIILDGNGRWAKNRNLPRLAGHRAGLQAIRRAIEIFNIYDIKYLTLYAFSTENWNRPKSEVSGLFRLLMSGIERETRGLHKLGVRIRHLGSIEGLSEKLQEKINKSMELTRNNVGMTLCVAFNYGGRTEIVDAVRLIIRDGIAPENVNESLMNSHMYTAGLPDPDLIIRTGGEMRLSNFLVWQSVYSEYYSTPVLWPDFDKSEIDKALEAYSQRKRRFGKIID